MPKNHWTNDWRVGVRVWVERQGKAVLGEGRAELLAAIDYERSITRAAKSVGMSYRRAWTMIQEINAAAGDTLVEAAVGGKTGGGARLTPRGRLAIDVYGEVRRTLLESAGGALQRITGSHSDAARPIHVFAAISLQEAIGQVLIEYVFLEPLAHVRTAFGASNELADHLLAGAPGDLFLSAEPAELDRLDAVGRVDYGSRRTIARNGLAIVGSKKVATIRRPADLLSAGVKKIALAEPACPLGRYSKEYLEQARVHDALLPKVLHVDNSRAVLAAVISGAASAGVAFSSDATSGGAWQTLFRVPIAKAAATYAGAVIQRGRRSNEEARKLLDFLSSPAAQRCLRRCGFRPNPANYGTRKR